MSMSKRHRGPCERGCTHALGASEYCTIVGCASDGQPDSDEEPPSSGPRKWTKEEVEEEIERGTSEPNAHRLHVPQSAIGACNRHPCDEPGCKYRATASGHLERHKRTHSGERPGMADRN